MSKKDLYNYKRFAICTARDFEYGNEVIEKIKNSTSADEISLILDRARNAM